MSANDDIPGLIGDVIRKGIIDTVDLSTGTATVKVGDITSPPLPWCECAGAVSTWCPPSEGESVILLCMEADIEAAVILRGLNTTANPPPITGPRVHIKMPNGTFFDYDYEANVLTLDLTGKAILKAPDGFEFEGDVKVTGKVDATGKITSDDDVLAAAISLKGHKHGGVSAGAAKTAVPE
ncbi:phage baseplate assembly protein V [Asticcacaulis machinosus]|uniref:Phage baseplate assembly protein V n=1 Tax=Asticcacaulis machinosus TaxID=2984211 RepID=A0ABT5HGX9_9CAUL|nr:phage baseplate assembly protein V [Asticcacaulis machinosus]MDC7675385.1 phage baseplate assembly protein V [Asticcacaulis machinosus]